MSSMQTVTMQANEATADDKAELSFLETLFEEQELILSTMDLQLQNIEIKNRKDFSGELAIIYEKKLSEVNVDEGIHGLYHEERSQWNKSLIQSYDKLFLEFEKRVTDLEKDIPVPHVRNAMKLLQDCITILKTNALLTLDMELQQSLTLSQGFTEAFKQDFTITDNKLSNKVIAIERLKNVELQQIIDQLSKARADYEQKVIQNFEVSASEELENYLESILKDRPELSLDVIKSNQKELFAVIKYKDIQAVHGGILHSEGAVGQELSSEELRIVEKIKADYLITNQREPEITAAAEYILDITNKSQKIMTITLETEGQRLVQTYNTRLTTLIDEKKLNPQTNYGKQVELLMETFRDELRLYQEKSGKIQDDADQVDKVFELLEQYDKKVLHYEKIQKQPKELEDEFNAYHILIGRFDQTLPVEIRMTLEGTFLVKTLANGQLDTTSNYYHNLQSSGNQAMRFYQDETIFIGFYEASAVSMKTVHLGIVFYGLVLLILLFVRRSWFKNLVILSTLLIISLIVLYPLVWVVGASFNNSTSLGSIGISPFPKQWTLIQYERLFLTTDYAKWFGNSFKIALSNMAITVTLAASAAYVFSRFKFKGKKIGLMTMLIIQIFPSFSAMVAIYTLLANIKFLEFLTGETSLVNTHIGLILVYCAGQIPYNTWLIKGYFDTLPMSMDEAARIDGATHMQAFIKIILPLGRPIIAFVAVTSFMAPWMDFILPRLLLKSTEKKTLAVGLFEMINGQSNNNFTLFAAGAVLVAVPITFLYAYLQKYIVKGLASGAVKG
jgi:arabinogalactan oligomer / maltooligosaccharide transport system permease protein